MNIAPSLNDADTYFIFRENGVEVKIVIANRRIFSNRFLTKNERNYVDRNFIKGMKTPSFYKKLNKLDQVQKNKVELLMDSLLR